MALVEAAAWTEISGSDGAGAAAALALADTFTATFFAAPPAVGSSGVSSSAHGSAPSGGSDRLAEAAVLGRRSRLAIAKAQSSAS
jgi:hypothetical protein